MFLHTYIHSYIYTYIQLVFLHSVLQLLVTDNLVPSSLFLFTVKMEAIRSLETSVLIEPTWRHIHKDGIPAFLSQNSLLCTGLKRDAKACSTQGSV
jgi:hypothetical protein